MSLIVADRVQETTTTTGTGTLNLGGAVTQFRTFIATVGNGNTCSYCILDGNNTDWEVGTGTVTSGTPNTLSRTTVFSSTNSGSKISLSANTHRVFLTLPANHEVTSTSLDNAFGSTQGNILYRGASAWTVLAPGTSGNVLTTGGAGANPSWAAASGGGGLFAALIPSVPTQANTGLSNWLNQGTATATDSPAGISLHKSSNGSAEGIRALYKAAPTAPYKIRALVGITSNLVTNNHAIAGIGWYDGTSKLQLVYLHGNAGSVLTLGTSTYSSPTASNASSDLNSAPPNPVWLYLEDDGTSIHMGYTVGGEDTYFHMLDTTKAGGYLGSTGYSNVLFFINPYGSETFGTLLGWNQY